MKRSKKKYKRTINILPYVATFIVGVFTSYSYFSSVDHIYVEHEYEGKANLSTILEHIRKGCEDFGTKENN